MILVNLKNYEQGVGEKAISLAKVCEKVAGETGVDVVAVVGAFDVFGVKQSVKIPVWVQHVDGTEMGAFTGWLLPEAAKMAGASGTILNHSEHKLMADELRKSVTRCKEVGLAICICADSVEEAQIVAELAPDYIAYEPPELIGSKDKSVASEHPDVVSRVVNAVGVPVLIGAGVHTAEDVRVGLKLGAKGVLVASDVVKAADSEKELAELANAFKI